MAFKMIKPAGNATRPVLKKIIKNSVTLKVGDLITNGAGFADVYDNTSDSILGIVNGFVTVNGAAFGSHAVDANDFDGTYTASTLTYVASASNQTGKKVAVLYTPIQSEWDLMEGTLDDVKATTTGSNVADYYLAALTSDAGLLDESTASTSSTSTQFVIVDGQSGDGTRKVIVRCHARFGE